MATSIGQYALVFLPGDRPLPDREAWRATVYGVTQSRTRLKRLSSSSRKVWQPVLANTLQYSCLENPPDREAWQATVYSVAELDRTEVTLRA